MKKLTEHEFIAEVISQGSLDLVKLFFQRNPTYTCDDNGNYPLEIAINYKRFAIAYYLCLTRPIPIAKPLLITNALYNRLCLEHIVNAYAMFESPLLEFAYKGDLEILEKNKSDLPGTVDSLGRTVLFYAVAGGCFEAVKFLSLIPELNVMDTERMLAINFAAYHGHLNILQLLYQDNPTLSPETDDHLTALLHYAIQEGHLPIVQWLVIEKDAGVEKNKDGKNAFEASVFYGQAHITSWLFFKRSMKYEYPMHLLAKAASRGHLDTLILLVEDLQIPLELMNSDGDNVLQLASMAGHLSIIEWALRKGVPLNHINNAERTALDQVAKDIYPDTALLLLERGGKLTLKNKSKINPIVLERSSKIKETFAIRLQQIIGQIEANHLTEIDFPGNWLNKSQISQLIGVIRKHPNIKTCYLGYQLLEASSDDISYMTARFIDMPNCFQAIERQDALRLCGLTHPTSEIRKQFGYTAYHLAVMAGSHPLIEEIAKITSYLKEKDHQNCTPLQLAINLNHTKCVTALKKIIAQKEQTVILSTIAYNNANHVLSKLIEKNNTNLAKLVYDIWQCIYRIFPYQKFIDRYRKGFNSYQDLFPKIFISEFKKNYKDGETLTPHHHLFNRLASKKKSLQYLLIRGKEAYTPLPLLHGLSELISLYDEYIKRFSEATAVDRNFLLTAPLMMGVDFGPFFASSALKVQTIMSKNVTAIKNDGIEDIQFINITNFEENNSLTAELFKIFLSNPTIGSCQLIKIIATDGYAQVFIACAPNKQLQIDEIRKNSEFFLLNWLQFLNELNIQFKELIANGKLSFKEYRQMQLPITVSATIICKIHQCLNSSSENHLEDIFKLLVMDNTAVRDDLDKCFLSLLSHFDYRFENEYKARFFVCLKSTCQTLLGHSLLLHVAVDIKCTTLISFLLSVREIDMQAVNEYGHTALEVATMLKEQDIIELLRNSSHHTTNHQEKPMTWSETKQQKGKTTPTISWRLARPTRVEPPDCDATLFVSN